MKRIALLALFAIMAAGVGWSLNIKADGAYCATCTGADPCKACKNCKSCKHCKGSGSCGACK